ncbi:OmpA family protein [Vibrio alginolyticus]|uniref:OmpA family protein n=1 Tax=Vibrio alginolyticus TaxID=663 RepID=UPI0006CAA034|nr:OmpA family protein [Vibrio alginolyticus]KPM98629.1 hypothetical protein AOG25_09345 [Vibrio alginolyticus]
MKSKLLVIAAMSASAIAGANELNAGNESVKFHGHNLPTIILAKELNDQFHQFRKEKKAKSEIGSLSAKLLEAEAQLNKKNRLMAELNSQIQSGDWTYETFYVTGDDVVNSAQKEVLVALFGIAIDKNLYLKVSGRADPRGDYDYNLELAKKRAENVAKIAKNAGISNEMIKTSYSVTQTEIKNNRELHFFDRNTSITFSSKH